MPRARGGDPGQKANIPLLKEYAPAHAGVIPKPASFSSSMCMEMTAGSLQKSRKDSIRSTLGGTSGAVLNRQQYVANQIIIPLHALTSLGY